MLVVRKLRLQLGAGSDARVLKAQLELMTKSWWITQLLTPFVALGITWVASDATGYFGHRPFRDAIFGPLLTIVAVVLSSVFIWLYRQSNTDHPDKKTILRWINRIALGQVAISIALGVTLCLLWSPGDKVNHLFLLTCIIALFAGLVVACQMRLVLGTIAPVVLIMSARFLFGELAMDYLIGGFMPFAVAHLLVNVNHFMARVSEDSQLRFQVQDLARELEETRDDALRKRLEAETANASKTTFLANMSHELRTPLNAILGFSEIIAKECCGPVSARYQEYANDIHSSGAHLLSLINDLLDVAKIEAGKMDICPYSFDARPLFDAALKLLAAKAREKQQLLVIEIDPGAPPLYADERALKQILINLVSNAVKFTPEGGRISVVGSRARNGNFQILVEDNGPGIAADKLGKIFTPFNQVDNRYDRQAGGTGLGLALIRGLAELHGGRAWIESEAGKGCRAYVELPSAPPSASAIGTTSHATPAIAAA